MTTRLSACLAAAAVAAGLATLSASSTFAQEWPTRPVRVILPVASGAATELVGRAVADEVLATLKQPMVIENRPAGGGTQAAEFVSKAEPDGYTLFLATAGTMTIIPHLLKRIGYDPLKDFTPLTTAVELPICLVVHKDIPANNIQELIAYAKANPGKLSFGSSGQGSTHHLAGEFLKVHAGIDIVHVPYRGGGPAMTDLLSGQIQMLFATFSTVIPQLESGNLKVLGMIEAARSRARPDFPTIGESLPGYSIPGSWLGYMGPPNMPPALVTRINTELVKAINAPRVKQAIEKAGFEVVTSTPADHMKTLQAGYDRYKKIITDAKIEPQ